MRRVFRVHGHRRIYTATLLVLPLVVLGLETADVAHDRGQSPLMWPLLGFLMAVGFSFAFLTMAFVRIVVTEREVVAYDAVNRVRYGISVPDLTGYVELANGTWCLVTEDRARPIVGFDEPEFHRAIATVAPHALRAKRWRCGQLPSNGRQGPYSLFRATPFVYVGAPFFLVLGVVAVVTHRFGALGACLPQLAIVLYEASGVFGRLTMDDEGITVRWPWSSRTIPWEEVTAVFCDRVPKRHFIVVSHAASIVVPPPIAGDLDAMRKLFYSLPQGTRCVNFGPDDLKGYRRRRRKRAPAASPQGEPILGF